jgi:D-alanyl-D-alanine dipeptidase
MSTFPLVPVHASILSSYDAKGQTGGPRANLRPLAQLGKAGIAASDTAAALLLLHEEVTAAGGDLRITECHRDVAVQVTARAKYDRWVAAGKPKPGTAGFDAKTMKADYVAVPGKSNHNAGRAIDVHLGALKFPNVPAGQQLDKLWSIAVPLGWSPVLKAADEGASEAWHFDYWGELRGVFSRLGYEQAALCGALLVGHAGEFQTYARLVQALLCRAGFNIGLIDGAIGPRTRAVGATALNMLEADFAARLTRQDDTLIPKLAALAAG